MVDPDDVTTAAERSAYAAPDAATAPAPAAAGPDSSAPAPSGPAADAPAPAPSGPGFLASLPGWIVPAILLGVPLLIGLAVQVQPDLYDDFVWKYYWGPIKADAENLSSLTHDGVVAHSGYNVVNTLSWAVLLAVCILGIAQLLERFKAPMDDKMIIGATAWVIVGSAAHVLEDAGLFTGWLQYLFITPPIYLLFGAFGLSAFLVGQWMKRAWIQKGSTEAGLHAALRLLWIVHAVLVLVWTGLWLKDWPNLVAYVNPLWVAGFALVNFLVARAVILRTRTIDPNRLTLVLSLGTYLLVGAYVLTYVVDPWNSLAGDAMPSSTLLAPALALAAALVVLALARKAPKAILGILLVGAPFLGGVVAVVLVNLLADRLGLPIPHLDGLRALAVTLLVALGLGYKLWKDNKGKGDALRAQVAASYALGINLLVVFAQMVDAFATSIGIDLAGYSEKHVLSARVIDATREFGHDVGSAFIATYPTFLGFAPVKLLVSLGVIYAIDVQSRDDAGQHPTLIGLVKFAIIMVGIGPGVRDFVRLSLGV